MFYQPLRATLLAAPLVLIGFGCAPAGDSPVKLADFVEAEAKAGGPRYLGDKPWNQNPPPLPDNPAYKKKNQRIDVVGRNGLLFVDPAEGGLADWPKPKAALVLSGVLSGYIEPCGCAGLENMRGGLSRRHTLIQQLANDGWPLVKLDLGELVRRLGPQSVIKYQRTIDALRLMGYNAVGFGPADLRLPVTDLLGTLPGDSPTHYVSANVGLLGFDNEDYCAPFRVVEAGGLKFGVTSVTGGLGQQGAAAGGDVAVVSPAEGLRKVLPKLQAQKCDRLVLLANTNEKQARELGQQFPQFDIVVTHGESDPPPPQLVPVAGSKARLAELSHKGMYVGVVAFYDDAAQPIRYQRVPLDARFGDSADMKKIMEQYQEQLKQEGFERLGIHALAHPRGAKFVGSQKCGECHTKAYAVWEKTPHAVALDTLEKLSPPRQFDAECLSCHVTGWEPQDYRPFAAGFLSRDKTPHLIGNGCENCHGPGSNHVAVEEGEVEVDDAKRDRLRAQMRLTIADAKANNCARCHDLDNSPDYVIKGFDAFWPKIEHKGKD